MPRPPYDSDSPVAWQNYIVVQSACAARGLIGPGIRALACRCVGDTIELHFLVPRLTEVEQEDIDEIVGAFDVLMSRPIPVIPVIHARPEDYFGLFMSTRLAAEPMRVVYHAKGAAREG